MQRQPGPSARLKLTLSYAGFLLLAGVVMIAAAWIAGRPGLLDGVVRHIPDGVMSALGRAVPGNSSFLLRAFAPTAAVMLVFLLVFGLLGGWVLAGRMLAPLDQITEAARTAAAGSLSHRIDMDGRADEFRELADAFDAMLARLEAHVAGQQRFAANASHELRTPLAITQTLLDVARNDPDRTGDELDDRLRAVNTRAIELTEALLLLSRSDQRAFTREDVDLSLLAEEATEALLPLAEKRGVTVETTGSLATAYGSPALLLQMTSNLLHNAIVHNCEHGSVQVRTEAHAGWATVTVENTGDVLSPELVSTLAEPFQRGSDRARTDHAGVGLGLAIVTSIAEAHDGTLELEPRPGGGLRATVRLPAGHGQKSTTVRRSERSGSKADR
jgi:two-component system sensor histidine kinase VanS